MTNTDTRDVEATAAQIRCLAAAGCDIVRVSVYDEACAKAVRTLVEQSPVPLVADIHFDYTLALQAVENGISKLRINPATSADRTGCAPSPDLRQGTHVPIRIGVNSGSVEKELLNQYGRPCAEAMAESALRHGAAAGKSRV